MISGRTDSRLTQDTPADWDASHALASSDSRVQQHHHYDEKKNKAEPRSLETFQAAWTFGARAAVGATMRSTPMQRLRAVHAHLRPAGSAAPRECGAHQSPCGV